MDLDSIDFDEIEFTPNIPKKKGSGSFFWNLLTALMLLVAVIFVVFFALVFRDPYTAFNPFPPPTLPAVIVIPTETVPGVVPSQTPTAAATLTPLVLENKPTHTATQEVTPPTEIALIPTIRVDTPTPVRSSYAFILQSPPAAINASVLYPERGCNWLGVGGQVVDLQGRSYTGITVQLGGSLDNKAMNLTSLTGTVRQYGQAGYEFTLGDIPIASRSSLWLRLLDQAGIPLSERVFFDTYEDCQSNLIVINFKQVR